MALVEPYIGQETGFNVNWIEQVILKLADIFDIRIVWDKNTTVITAVCAVAGGIIGGYSGGRLGAALGAGIGGATGLVTTTIVPLRDIWTTIKEKLKELFYIVYNFLRRLDPNDYVRAFDILMACTASRRELIITILDFIAHKLNHEVFSSLTAA